jgi:hypothetical protein
LKNKLIEEDDTKQMYYEVTYMYIKGEEIVKDRSVMIELGDMLTIQSLLEQSLFYLLGWQVLGTPQILESDIGNSQNSKPTPFSPFKK